jgi:hypothetical protein
VDAMKINHLGARSGSVRVATLRMTAIDFQ